MTQRFTTDGTHHACAMANPYTEVVKVIFQGRADFTCITGTGGHNLHAAAKYTHPQYPCFNAVQAVRIGYI
ncbi:hypothetical protein D3C71_2065060 [compost metagenome]